MFHLAKSIYFCTYLSLACSHFPTIGILHDRAWKSIHPHYHRSIANFQLILREILLSDHYHITSQDISISLPLKINSIESRSIPSPISTKWSFIIIISSCSVLQRTLVRYNEELSTKSVLLITLDRCPIPQIGSYTVYFKLAQDCLPCFQEIITDWLNSKRNLKSEPYNGDQLSLLKERNLAAKEYVQQNSFKLSTMQLPPMVSLFKNQDGHLKAKGLFMDIVNAIVESIAAKYIFTFPGNPPSPPFLGGFENGTWTGLNGMVFRREVDCGVYSYTTSRERIRNFDVLTSGTSITPMTILIPAPEFVHNLEALVKPFDLTVWIVLIITILISAMVLASLNNKASSYLKVCGDQLIVVVQLTCSQGTETPEKSLAGRLVTGAWCIVALVCGYVYTSTLTSYIAVPNARPKIESLADLAYKRTLKPLVFGWGMNNNLFAKASEGPSFVLRGYFEKHPEHVLTDFKEGIEKVRTGDYAFVLTLTMAQSLIDQDYRKNGRCSFSTPRQPVSRELYTWIFPKNSATSIVLNTGYLRARDFGLEDFLAVEYGMVAKYCQKENDFLKPDPVFTLTKVKSCFLILAFGFPLALIAFLIEICANLEFSPFIKIIQILHFSRTQ